jgi:hypothetical protein
MRLDECQIAKSLSDVMPSRKSYCEASVAQTFFPRSAASCGQASGSCLSVMVPVELRQIGTPFSVGPPYLVTVDLVKFRMWVED